MIQLPDGASLIERFAARPAHEREEWLASSPDFAQQALDSWDCWARVSQTPPPGDWRHWLILAGRGFGKTRAGSEWVRRCAASMPGAQIALVGATLSEARAVMVEGPSGLLSINHGRFAPKWEPLFVMLNSFQHPFW